MTANHLDQKLIEQLLSAESITREKAWEFIYKSFYPMIKELITSHGGSLDDAVDTFQDGLLILNNSLTKGTFRYESSISTYLFGICKNLWQISAMTPRSVSLRINLPAA